MRLEDASGAIKDNFKVPDGPNGQLILRWDPNGDEKLCEAIFYIPLLRSISNHLI